MRKLVFTVYQRNSFGPAYIVDEIKANCGLKHNQLTHRFQALHGKNIWVDPKPSPPSGKVTPRDYI